jgi:hypothetical protein
MEFESIEEEINWKEWLNEVRQELQKCTEKETWAHVSRKRQ